MSVRKDTRYLIGSADVVGYCAAACLLLVCVAGLFASASFIGVEGYPWDAELTKRYLAHKDDWVLRESHQPVDVGALAELGAERAARYET